MIFYYVNLQPIDLKEMKGGKNKEDINNLLLSNQTLKYSWMLVPLLFSWSRVEAILENRYFSEVALSVDGLAELVYELVNSSCMLFLVSTITMTSADQTA